MKGTVRHQLKEIKLSEVKRLKLEDGEVLVLRSPDRLSMEAVERLKAQLLDVFPNNRVLVLENGADLSVVARF